MDFSLVTLFVVPTSQSSLPTTGSTQDLTAGQVGFFSPSYATVTAGTIPNQKYVYVAQGRANEYLQGSKRSDKIDKNKIVDWYFVEGNATALPQITEISDFTVGCGEYVTLTLRAHSSYIDTLYFNGFTRSVTVQAPCCDCGADPCTDVDAEALVDLLIAALNQTAPGINPDNISFSTFYTFAKVGTGATAKLRITGKTLTAYGQPCDVAAFPYEYDRMWFNAFIYEGPATTADFIVADACDLVATVVATQRSSYPAGTSAEIAQLEKDYYSYQAGYLKHLYRMGGYNYNFESYVTAGAVYDTFYIKYKPAKEQYTWGDYIIEDATVILAVPQSGGLTDDIQTLLEAYLGAAEDFSATPIFPTTTTTTTAP
jgi:hypothetical protein